MSLASSECVSLLLNRCAVCLDSSDILACVLSLLLKLLQVPITPQLQQRISIFLQTLRTVKTMTPLMTIEAQLVSYYCSRWCALLSFPVDATLVGHPTVDPCSEVIFTDTFSSLLLQYISQQTDETIVAEGCLLCLYVIKTDTYCTDFLQAGGLEWMKQVAKTNGKNQSIIACITQSLCWLLKSGEWRWE